MKKNIALRNLSVLFISLLPMVYLSIVWNKIPEKVVLHYNAKFEPDRIGDKSELWLVTGILVVVSILVYLLLQNLHLFDPKRKNKTSSPAFGKLAAGLVVFMAALNCIIIASAAGGNVPISRFLFPLIGLLFAFIGNYMHSLKPNYFAGIRLPWTLSSDENWRLTHKLAGKLWFLGGLIIVIASLFIPAKHILYFFIPVMILLVAIPVVYSFRLFKNKKP